MKTLAVILVAAVLGLSATVSGGERPVPMPKADVVEVPAIGNGLSVSNVFQTNMVLQRDKSVQIWGWAAPGEEVTIAFAGDEVKTNAEADRRWKAALKAHPANATPQNLVVKGQTETLTLENILIGDVWVLGGQSNMEFPISNVDDGELEIASANFPQIRLLTIPKGKGFDSVHSFERLHEWSDWSGRHFRKGDWFICSPTTVREFSAIGYVFGRRVHMAASVPIGLIDTSVGGTTVEAWTPEDVVRKIENAETKAKVASWDERIAQFDPQDDLKKRIENYNKNKKGDGPPTDLRPGPKNDQNRPGWCYKSLIRPLTGLQVKGAVWHQGFNNCFDGSSGGRMYYQIFGKMITAWRATFNDPQMAFCIISLCTAGEPQTWENFIKPMADPGAMIREAQYKTYLDFRKAGDLSIGFATSSDLRKSFYHPQIKIPNGERAAKWALATQYKLMKDNVWQPAEVLEVTKDEASIRLKMSTNMKRSDDSEDRMLGFAVAGEDRIFYPVEAKFNVVPDPKDNKKFREERNILVLTSPFVSKPIHYRYAWSRNPMGNLISESGVTLPGQRSDDWNYDEIPEGSSTPYNGRAAQKQLEVQDMERQLRESEAKATRLKAELEKAKGSKK